MTQDQQPAPTLKYLEKITHLNQPQFFISARVRAALHDKQKMETWPDHQPEEGQGREFLEGREHQVHLYNDRQLI